MAVLKIAGHVRGDALDCMAYIQNPDKVIANEQSANVMRYMQSHCVEDVMSVGYNGCSGVRELAIEQFRAAEEAYRAIHPQRKKQETRITVEQYLKSNHRKKLPKHIKVDDDGMITVRKSEVVAEHVVLSLHKTDKADAAKLQRLLDDFMRHPYMAGFPAMTNIHNNTDELHGHILLCNFAFDGSRKFSLSGTKLRKLRRHLDKLCYKYGLSIIDTQEARLDPEHAAWIDHVKSEGKIKVWPEQKVNKRWKAADTRAKAKLIEVHRGINERASVPESSKKAQMRDIEEIIKSGLFIGERFECENWFSPVLVAERERERRRKNREADLRYQLRFYSVPRRMRYFDPTLGRYVEPSLLTLIFMLAKVSITGETDFLQKYFPSKYEELVAEFEPIDPKIQEMMNSISVCSEFNCRTPDELQQRAQDVGMLIRETRRAIQYDQTTLSRTELVDAIDTWRDRTASEDARKAAYAVLASHGANTLAAREDLYGRILRARKRLSDNEMYLKELGKDYHRIKVAIGSLERARFEVEHYNTPALRLAREMPHPELSARIAAADPKHTKGKINEKEQTR